MRLLMSLLVILGLLLGLGFWINYSLQTSTQELASAIDQVNTAIEENQWEAARQHSQKLAEVWEEKARWWPIFLDHQEMDNIDFSLARVQAYVMSKNDPLARGQLAELKLMIKHIPEKEAVNMKNIL